ncbi:MAG TPA: DUF1844 domain-containing protein [Candidatus Omnitrophota bacterium]|nr:DUF1844 domain-containing protein [Candidatus Omnitrophota bacterium]HPS19989.1 DUF1844 domain-containing protein [Candidatus Omnitrophota bacterium]
MTDNDVKIDFSMFLSGLFAEGLMSLGLIENPLTGKKEKNLDQARYLIDTLDMLKQKTAGNLTEDEAHALERGLYELRMAYISFSKESSPGVVPGTAGETPNKGKIII